MEQNINLESIHGNGVDLSEIYPALAYFGNCDDWGLEDIEREEDQYFDEVGCSFALSDTTEDCWVY